MKGLGNIEDICFPGGFGFLDFNETTDIETFPRLLLLINSSAHAKADTLVYDLSEPQGRRYGEVDIEHVLLRHQDEGSGNGHR